VPIKTCYTCHFCNPLWFCALVKVVDVVQHLVLPPHPIVNNAQPLVLHLLLHPEGVLCGIIDVWGCDGIDGRAVSGDKLPPEAVCHGQKLYEFLFLKITINLGGGLLGILKLKSRGPEGGVASRSWRSSCFWKKQSTLGGSIVPELKSS